MAVQGVLGHRVDAEVGAGQSARHGDAHRGAVSERDLHLAGLGVDRLDPAQRHVTGQLVAPTTESEDAVGLLDDDVAFEVVVAAPGAALALGGQRGVEGLSERLSDGGREPVPEQRKSLRAIEDELEDVKKKLGRIWHHIETTDTAMADASDRIREHRERQERLEYFAEQARADLAQRRKVLDNVNTIAAYAKDMKDFLNESELTERRAFIQSFVKEIVVVPGDALLRYTVPMPDDSLIPGRSAERVALNGSVLPTLPDGGSERTELRVSAHSPPSQISKMVLSTVYVGGPTRTELSLSQK